MHKRSVRTRKRHIELNDLEIYSCAVSRSEKTVQLVIKDPAAAADRDYPADAWIAGKLAIIHRPADRTELIVRIPGDCLLQHNPIKAAVRICYYLHANGFAVEEGRCVLPL